MTAKKLSSEQRARLGRVLHEMGDGPVAEKTGLSRSSVTRAALDLPCRLATHMVLAACLDDLEREAEGRRTR